MIASEEAILPKSQLSLRLTFDVVRNVTSTCFNAYVRKLLLTSSAFEQYSTLLSSLNPIFISLNLLSIVFFGLDSFFAGQNDRSHRNKTYSNPFGSVDDFGFGFAVVLRISMTRYFFPTYSQRQLFLTFWFVNYTGAEAANGSLCIFIFNDHLLLLDHCPFANNHVALQLRNLLLLVGILFMISTPLAYICKESSSIECNDEHKSFHYCQKNWKGLFTLNTNVSVTPTFKTLTFVILNYNLFDGV